jgi:hypothetical protein
MRTRTLITLAFFALPTVAGSQVGRLPRGPQRTPTDPAAPLPKEIPEVSRALAFRRSRWSTEAYSLISTVSAPAGAAGVTSYNTYGAGTHAAYRFTDAWSATADLTVSPLGGSSVSETAEFGSRFAALPWDEDYRSLRPFVDVRAVYMHMSDLYATPEQISGGVPGGNRQLVNDTRYSRGFGAVAGAGVEFPLTSAWAFSTELSAMRNRMTAYQINGPAAVPGGPAYWMTSVRIAFGIKYNRVTAMHMSQTPR